MKIIYDILRCCLHQSPFGRKGDAFVVTWHGGRDGARMLPPDVIEKAVDRYRNNKGGLTAVYAVDLKDAYGTDVFTDLLHGGFPDGKTADLFSLDQVKAGEHYDHVREFKGFGIVRPKHVAQETHSGYQPIQDLALFNEKGEIIGAEDSRVITYNAGAKEGGHFLKSAQNNFSSGKVGVFHPFNDDKFDPKQAQACVLFLDGSNDGLGGDDNINNNGRFV